MMHSLTRSVFATLSLTLAAAPALAIEADLAPFVSGGQIRAHAYSDDLGAFVDTSGNARVFAYDLGEGVSAPPMIALDDPGFNTEEFEAEFGVPTGFAPGTFIGIQVLAPLKYWDGSGAPSFAEVTNGESILLDNFGVSRRVGSAGVTETTPFFVFEVEDAPDTGAFHGHISSILEDDSLALLGIYAIEAIVINGNLTNPLTGEGTVFTSPAPSQSVFFLYNNGLAEDEYEEAVERFAASLTNGDVSVVPEPAAFMLLTLAAAGLWRRRRLA